MSSSSPEPEVYMPSKGESNDALIKALENTEEMSPEQIIEYRKKIDKDRVAQPRKGKFKKEEIKIEEK